MYVKERKRGELDSSRRKEAGRGERRREGRKGFETHPVKSPTVRLPLPLIYTHRWHEVGWLQHACTIAINDTKERTNGRKVSSSSTR